MSAKSAGKDIMNDISFKDMTMALETITPAKAAEMLKQNTSNRTLTEARIESYANDIKLGRWTACSTPITFSDTHLLDGQHRLYAIVKANTPVNMWVCRHAPEQGIYDEGQPRSPRQNIMMRSRVRECLTDTRTIAACNLVIHLSQGIRNNVRIGTIALESYMNENEDVLMELHEIINSKCGRQIGRAYVSAGMLSAIIAGVPTQSLKRFYDVLADGIAEDPKEYPIVAYRNYLFGKEIKKLNGTESREDHVKRCQNAIYNYMAGTCIKNCRTVAKYIYPLTKAQKANL